MNQNSDRNFVIALLEKLGGEDDAEVLAAGRALHAKIDEMGVAWDQLLVPDDEAVPDSVEEYDEDEDEYEDEDEDTSSDADEPVDDEFEPVGDAAEDFKLIDRLLAANGISAEFRDELQGYKEDIKEGEFSAADRKYIEALRNRLAGNKKSKSRR